MDNPAQFHKAFQYHIQVLPPVLQMTRLLRLEMAVALLVVVVDSTSRAGRN